MKENPNVFLRSCSLSQVSVSPVHVGSYLPPTSRRVWLANKLLSVLSKPFAFLGFSRASAIEAVAAQVLLPRGSDPTLHWELVRRVELMLAD